MPRWPQIAAVARVPRCRRCELERSEIVFGEGEDVLPGGFADARALAVERLLDARANLGGDVGSLQRKRRLDAEHRANGRNFWRIAWKRNHRRAERRGRNRVVK